MWTDRALQLRDIQDKDLGAYSIEDNMQDTKMRIRSFPFFSWKSYFIREFERGYSFYVQKEKKAFFFAEKLQEYKNWFCSSKNKWTEAGVYLSFLEERKVRGNGPEDTIIRVTKENLTCMMQQPCV